MMPSRNIFMILCFTLWGQKGCSWSILVRNHKHPVQIKNTFRKLLKQIVSPRLFVSNVDSAVRSLGWSIKLADGWNVEPEQVWCRKKLWKYLIFLWWTKCRGKEKEKKTKECRERWNLVTNSLQISGLSPTPYLKMNHLEIDTCYTSVYIWHDRSFQLNDLVTFFYIIRMLCSFSAGEGGDCSKNLWILRRFLCVRPPPLDNIKIFNKHLQISPIYCAVVALYLTQSLQKWRAENFFLVLHLCHSLL